MGRTPFGIATLLLLVAVRPTHAQVASLGKGWLLDSAGSVTSVPAEVISGTNSIKGSSSDPDPSVSHWFLVTDPGYLHFTPNQTYTITVNYRVITAPPGGLSVAFNSPTADAVQHFGPRTLIRGADGSSGTATLSAALENYSDYHANFSLVGPGAILVDDVRIRDSAGQLVASEDAEGPTLVPGPLDFHVTGAIALLTEGGATVNSAAVKDLDGDGHAETILMITNAHTLVTPFQPVIVESSGQMRLATGDFFPTGAPTLKNSPVTLFPDINGDGLQDIVFAEAGLDFPPWTGSRLGVALNVGGGKYRDVSSLIPADQQTDRAYAVAVGDVLGDGRVEIILPDETDGANTAVLRWNGDGFDEIRNWIPQSIWTDAPAYLHAQSWMILADLDQDGKQDLLVTGQDHNPNFQIVFGGTDGFTAGTLVTLPDGPFGHITNPGAPPPPIQPSTSEVSPVLVADFDNDGRPDIFAIERQQTLYQPGTITDTNDIQYTQILANGGIVVGDSVFQMLLNEGSRKFANVSSASPLLNLGKVEYNSLLPIDLNNDGFLDVVGVYSADSYARVHFFWGTTLFLNDGTGIFQVVDGKDFLPVTTMPSTGQRWNLGSFVPTVVTPQRTEGIVYESVGGCGLGFCPKTGLNLYKVVANAAIGTGPGFADSAALGVPGFNEFYYLRHHPDAAAAVQRGDYPNGLAHFRAVGAALGYAAHAPRAATDPAVTVTPALLRFGATSSGSALVAQTSSQALRILQTGAGSVTWTATSNQPWLTVSPTTGTGTAVLSAAVMFDRGLPVAGESAGSITITFSGARISSATVTVAFTTKPQGSASAPFGSVDTPTNGTTGIAGSIAVTGWALDDIGVTRVTVCRDASGSEVAPVDPNCAGNAKIYIGDAVFIDGARSDVQALNPTAPLNSRGGWGYLLLTNFLPGLGNGTFTLRAYAFDADGHATMLGAKTMTCNNSASLAPFGAIDVPAQGAVVSGIVGNFGWVLSPGAARSDPPGGGIVHVFVDGVDQGPPNPGLWNARADLQALFTVSRFSGVNTALGVHGLDTTALSNGIHTIFWIVTGTGGTGTSGIGSRFFTVSNGSLQVNLSADHAATPRADNVIAASTTLAVPPTAAARIRSPQTLEAEIAAAPLDPTSVQGRRGFDVDRALQTYGPSSGRIDVQAEELDRIELHLSATPHHQYSGYLHTPPGLRPLPVGSTLDASTGAFTWAPGVGFYGKYDLTFVDWRGDRAVSHQDVRITLNAKGSNRVGPQTIIDPPGASRIFRFGEPMFIAGWAADLDSGGDSGVSAVHVWAYPLDEKGNRLDPIFLGPAIYGGARPDVASVYGDRFGNAGYGIIVNGLTPSRYDIAVFAFSTVVNNFTPAKVVRVVVQ